LLDLRTQLPQDCLNFTKINFGDWCENTFRWEEKFTIKTPQNIIWNILHFLFFT